ncbi:MAG: hypothetical protein R6X19_07545 [Kiritimatiellia bacterium]
MPARPLAALALAILASTTLAAKLDSARYQYRLDLTLPDQPPPEELYAVRLPPALFAQTQDSLADVRVADETLLSVPLEITRRTEVVRETHRTAVAFRRIGFSENAAANRVELIYECTNHPAGPTGITLHTPLRDFEKEVTVEAGNDGKTWLPLATGAVIFDASRFMDVSRKEVPFPPNRHRYFRIVLNDVTDTQVSPVAEIARYVGTSETGAVQHTDRTLSLQNRDFRIDRIDFWREEQHDSAARTRLIAYPVTNFTVRLDEKKNRTVVRFEAGRTPVTRVRLLTRSRNFSRPFALYAESEQPRNGRPARRLASGSLSQFAFRSLSQTNLTIAIPETRCSAFELVIENGDNPELALDGAILEGPELQLLFFGMAGAKYALYYGDPGAEKPGFDTTAIRMALDHGLMGRQLDVPQAETPNPGWKKPGGFRFNAKAALGGAMTVMVLVLGAALFKAARRV